MTTITSPLPPLNLFDVSRLSFAGTWVTLYDVPSYTVPASGVTPQQTIGTAAIMTGLMLTHSSASSVPVSVRISKGTGLGITSFTVLNGTPVLPNDITLVPFERQVMRDGERIEIKTDDGSACVAHLTFILNQRETFTVVA